MSQVWYGYRIKDRVLILTVGKQLVGTAIFERVEENYMELRWHTNEITYHDPNEEFWGDYKKLISRKMM